MSEELTTVATYVFNGPADVAKDHLERHGIPAFLADANLVTWHWLYGNAIGWIKLQVPASRAAEAVRLLEQTGQRHRRAVRHAGAASTQSGELEVNENSTGDLERQIYELRLYVASLYRLLVSKGIATQKEVQDMIEKTDSEDGAVDGEFYGDVSNGSGTPSPDS